MSKIEGVQPGIYKSCPIFIHVHLLPFGILQKNMIILKVPVPSKNKMLDLTKKTVSTLYAFTTTFLRTGNSLCHAITDYMPKRWGVSHPRPKFPGMRTLITPTVVAPKYSAANNYNCCLLLVRCVQMTDNIRKLLRAR